MKKITALICAFICCVLLSCDADHYAPVDKSLVVEGWICSDDYPVVFLTTSLVPDEKAESLDSLASHVVAVAKVTISDGDTTVILTARRNKNYRIPYYFTTSWMKGQVGKTYTLDVECEDYHATARTTIPTPPELDSITVHATGAEDQYALKAHISHRQSTGYYRFLVQKPREYKDLVGPLNGLLANDNITPAGCTWPISNPRTTWMKEYETTFTEDEELAIYFCAIDAEAYHFWTEFEREKYFSNNWFFPINHNLPTNIEGGIGYWCGYGATVYHGLVNPPIFYRRQ